MNPQPRVKHNDFTDGADYTYSTICSKIIAKELEEHEI